MYEILAFQSYRSRRVQYEIIYFAEIIFFWLVAGCLSCFIPQRSPRLRLPAAVASPLVARLPGAEIVHRPRSRGTNSTTDRRYHRSTSLRRTSTTNIADKLRCTRLARTRSRGAIRCQGKGLTASVTAGPVAGESSPSSLPGWKDWRESDLVGLAVGFDRIRSERFPAVSALVLSSNAVAVAKRRDSTALVARS